MITGLNFVKNDVPLGLAQCSGQRVIIHTLTNIINGYRPASP